jgi:DNA-binding transcriptional LysR family regulator
VATEDKVRVARPVAQLAQLDLNLLVTLRELIRERNVTRAAERVAISQPAASAALGRLRRHFDDELLVRQGADFVLSPLAAQLAERVELACAAAERVFAAESEFDALTCTREFTLLMADYVISVIGGPLSQLLEREAPSIRLHIRTVRESLAVEAADAIRRIDGIVAPPVTALIAPHLRSVELFRDRWVCVAWNGNRRLSGDRLALADLQDLSWVVPYLADRGQVSAAPVAQQFAMLGIQPRVAVRAESYQSVPEFVSGTDRVALMQERLARRVAGGFDLRVMDCPGDSQAIVEALWWCDDHDDDPAHAWLRAALARVSAALPV